MVEGLLDGVFAEDATIRLALKGLLEEPSLALASGYYVYFRHLKIKQSHSLLA